MNNSTPGQLPADTFPTAYSLQLELDPAKSGFSGSLELALELKAEKAAIHLHALELELETIVLDPASDARTLTARPAEGEGCEPVQGELSLGDGAPIKAGPHQLQIKYRGLYGQTMCGLYKVVEQGQVTLVTQFEAADARRAMPCFDEPGFKTPFTLALTVPTGTPCFSNAPEKSRHAVPNSDGTKEQVCFETTPPLPTYLMALCAGDFVALDAKPVGKTPVRVIVPKGKEALADVALEFTPELLATLEGIFGIPYPYAKLDVVAVPEFAAGAMENAGLVTFREVYLLADRETLTRSRARSIAEVIAHELAHHWFGNLVTMAWWDDLWLNEAFATWMAARVVDTWRPEYEQVQALLEVRSRILEQDALPSARQIQQPVNSVSDAEQAFDGITYYKGAAVLETIERWIGEDAFRAGVRAYLEANRWGNATSEDLFRELDKASGKPVSEVCRSYLQQAGVPLVHFEAREGSTYASQRPFNLLALDPPAPEALWSLPLPMPEGGTYILRETEAKLPYNLEGHTPNPNESSYLRWSVGEAELSALLQNQEALPLRERIGLVDASWASFSAGVGTLGQWTAVIAGLSEASERPLVERMASGLGRLLGLFPELDPGTDDAQRLKNFAQHILRAQVDRLGLIQRAGEDEGDTIARPSVLASAARFGEDPRVLEFAQANAKEILAGDSKLPTELAAVALSVAARRGDLQVSLLAEKLFEANDPERRGVLLGALARVPAGDPASAARDLVLDPNFRASDFRSIFSSQMQRHATRPLAYAWFLEHFEAIKARQPEFTFIQIGLMLKEFRESEALETAHKALVAKDVRGGQRSIEQGLQAATHAIALAEYGRPQLDQALSIGTEA